MWSAGADRGIARMSGPGATFAFHTDAGGTTWLTLRSLADVIRRYDAGAQRLVNPEPANEEEALLALDALKPAAQAVDDERVATFNRRSRRRH